MAIMGVLCVAAPCSLVVTRTGTCPARWAVVNGTLNSTASVRKESISTRAGTLNNFRVEAVVEFDDPDSGIHQLTREPCVLQSSFAREADATAFALAHPVGTAVRKPMDLNEVRCLKDDPTKTRAQHEAGWAMLAAAGGFWAILAVALVLKARPKSQPSIPGSPARRVAGDGEGYLPPRVLAVPLLGVPAEASWSILTSMSSPLSNADDTSTGGAPSF